MSEFLKLLLMFLEKNPGYFAGVAVLIAIAMLVYLARLYAPGLNSASKANESNNDSIKALTEVISGDQKDRQKFFTDLIAENKNTNLSIGNMMIAIKESSALQSKQQGDFIASLQASFERWFASVGAGFKNTMDEHEMKASQRANDAITLLQQLITRQTEIEKTIVELSNEVKRIADQLAELTPLVMAIKVEPPPPVTPQPIENREE